MPVATVGLSHSPLIGQNQPADNIVAAVDAALDQARAFVREFDPDLVVLYAPDHYNGFFYSFMPPFCLASAAAAVGDFGSATGELSVDAEAAKVLGEGALTAGIDLTLSARMKVDHGFVQPLEVLFGGLATVPVVPVFINSVATPLGPLRRIRLLGEAIGSIAATLDRRVLFIGSGGLSHDPPAPVLEGAPPRVAEALIAGTAPTPEQRARSEQRVLEAGRQYAAGTSTRIPLNPGWDTAVLDTIASGDLTPFDAWSNDYVQREGGNSGHEIRTWIAAFASHAAAGPYSLTQRFYRAIPEWIAGFAIATATSRD